MPKTVPIEIALLRRSLQRAKDIFAGKDKPDAGPTPRESAARAYGYLEMAVERFLEDRKGAK